MYYFFRPRRHVNRPAPARELQHRMPGSSYQLTPLQTCTPDLHFSGSTYITTVARAKCKGYPPKLYAQLTVYRRFVDTRPGQASLIIALESALGSYTESESCAGL